MLENSIILLTSDHGEMEGDHGLRGKGNYVYERNIHVPLIVYHPEIAGGARVARVTSHIDLAPTILGLVNCSDEDRARIGEGLRGESFAGTLLGKDEGGEGEALFAFEMVSFIDGDMEAGIDAEGNIGVQKVDLSKRGFMRALITPRYKFARYFSPECYNTPTTLDELYADNDVELYDLESDPDERTNLANDREGNAGLIEELNARLNDIVSRQIGVDDDASWKTYWEDAALALRS